MSNDDAPIGVDYPSPFDERVVELARSAARYLCILSPHLDRHAFDNPELAQAIGDLVRDSRQTDIRILIQNPRGVVGKGHRLLQLARRMPSRGHIQRLEHHPEWRGQTTVIRDRDGLLFKPGDSETEAFFYPDSQIAAQAQLELFDDLWRYSTEDPELRSLSL